MSSTATPMWSILPNKPRSLCGLGPEDLRQGGDPDLELLRRRLLGRDATLDLPAGRVEGLGEGLSVGAVGSGEHLHGKRGAAEADARAGGGAGALDQPV